MNQHKEALEKLEAAQRMANHAVTTRAQIPMKALDAITRARKHGITCISDLHIVLTVVDDSPLRICDIADLTGMSGPCIGLRLDGLRRAGWITVNPGRDRRAKVVLPTLQACEVFSDAL